MKRAFQAGAWNEKKDCLARELVETEFPELLGCDPGCRDHNESEMKRVWISDCIDCVNA